VTTPVFPANGCGRPSGRNSLTITRFPTLNLSLCI
jgi:hypothetical protein